MSSEIADWNGQPLRVVRIRGGVMAICDVRRVVLHDGPWPPPALKRKIKRSGQLRSFGQAAADDVMKADAGVMKAAARLTVVGVWLALAGFVVAHGDPTAHILETDNLATTYASPWLQLRGVLTPKLLAY